MSIPVGVALALVIIIALVVLMSTKKPGPGDPAGRSEPQDSARPAEGPEVEEPDAGRHES